MTRFNFYPLILIAVYSTGLLGCGESRKPSFSREELMPHFEENPLHDHKNNPAEFGSVHQFEVLIFPHWGKYPIPQGAEAQAQSVTIKTDQPCVSFLAVKNENQEWSKTGVGVAVLNQFTLNTTAEDLLPAPKYFECTAGFSVVRNTSENDKLENYKYSANFVAKIVNKTVHIINLIEPDEYIKGVVPAEVSASWPSDVLKAQAVAARTYAWWTVLNARSPTLAREYDMDDTVMYQAYTGLSKITTASTQAVIDTKNQVIRYQGEIIKAFFSADSGGYTADGLSTFEQDLPYCQAKPEIYDVSLYPSAWVKKINIKELTQSLVSEELLPAGVVIQSISVAEADVSGRVKKVKIVSNSAQVYFVKGDYFKFISKLRSSLFVVHVEGDDVVIEGKGYGHGVGMSQIGALQYVKQLGWTYDQILKFYYTGVDL